MGKRGPPKKPQELKELEGNPGKRQLNKNRVKACGEIEKPDFLSEYAEKVWDAIVNSMPPRFYTPCDAHLLASYCESADLFRRAVLMVRETGAVIVGKEGNPYQSPWVSIQNTQAKNMAMIGSRLGLDPSARSSLEMLTEDKPKSKFEGLVAIRGGLSGS